MGRPIWYLLLLLMACGPVIKYAPINESSGTQEGTDYPVAAFFTSAPQCPYRELGIVRASNGAFAGGMDTFVEAMKDKTREVGGDAIILGNIEGRTSGYVQVSPGVVAAAQGQAQTGIVIEFIQPDCMN